MKVKIFTKYLKTKGGLLSGVGTVSDDGLEDELNLWLASQPNIDVEKVRARLKHSRHRMERRSETVSERASQLKRAADMTSGIMALQKKADLPPVAAFSSGITRQRKPVCTGERNGGKRKKTFYRRNSRIDGLEPTLAQSCAIKYIHRVSNEM